MRINVLDQWLSERGAEARVLIVTGCTVEYLFDQQRNKDGKHGEWKPAPWIAERDTGLVINKTRSGQLRQKELPLECRQVFYSLPTITFLSSERPIQSRSMDEQLSKPNTLAYQAYGVMMSIFNVQR